VTKDPVVNPIENKIRSFSSLNTGWFHGYGRPPSARAIRNSLLLAERASIRGLACEAYPGPSAEIVLSVLRGELYMEFVVESEGTIMLRRRSSGSPESIEEGMSIARALDVLDRYRER
jgi:hypothetical protein